MNHNNHPEDQASIEAMHSDATNRINDQLLNFQDDAYALGRSRGVKEGQQLVGELIKALDCLTTLLDQDDENAVTGIFSTETHAAIDAAKTLVTKAKAGAA